VFGPTPVHCCSTLHFICRAVCFISLQFYLYLSECSLAPCSRFEYICMWLFWLGLTRQFVSVRTDGAVELCSLLQSAFLLHSVYVWNCVVSLGYGADLLCVPVEVTWKYWVHGGGPVKGKHDKRPFILLYCINFTLFDWNVESGCDGWRWVLWMGV
jgi:hypothetical protein